MDIKNLKTGDKVLVECTVQAVFANSKMVMVTTRDCTEGFDAYIDEITTKNDLGVDAISRAYLYNRIKGIDHDEDYECDEFGGSRITYHTCDWDEVLREIEDAPSVTPQELRKGYWIEHPDNCGFWEECSVCGTERAYPTDYCPDCGAKMVEPQESEDKE